MRRSIAVWLVFIGVAASPGSLDRVGSLDAPALTEVSGIVQSRRYPGIFWVHNDSGNPAELFAVRADGRLVRTYSVDAPNVDWEDIAIDDQGRLYLGDIGNNNLRLPIRAIYQIDEPDPSQPVDGPIKLKAATYYRFAKDDRFDAESLFISGSKRMVISKRFDGQEAEVFTIAPAPLFRPSVPERVASLPGSSEPVTGADLSTDGQRLAVVSNTNARVYRPDSRGGWTLLSTFPLKSKQFEAICWDGLDLILASEDRSVYRIVRARTSKDGR